MNHQIQIESLQNNAMLLRMQAETDEELYKKGLNSSLVLKKSQLEAETSGAQVEREKHNRDEHEDRKVTASALGVGHVQGAGGRSRNVRSTSTTRA